MIADLCWLRSFQLLCLGLGCLALVAGSETIADVCCFGVGVAAELLLVFAASPCKDSGFDLLFSFCGFWFADGLLCIRF